MVAPGRKELLVLYLGSCCQAVVATMMKTARERVSLRIMKVKNTGVRGKLLEARKAMVLMKVDHGAIGD